MVFNSWHLCGHLDQLPLISKKSTCGVESLLGAITSFIPLDGIKLMALGVLEHPTSSDGTMELYWCVTVQHTSMLQLYNELEKSMTDHRR
jgi:hypothetical protein